MGSAVSIRRKSSFPAGICRSKKNFLLPAFGVTTKMLAQKKDLLFEEQVSNKQTSI
jgi:hypothetical protein